MRPKNGRPYEARMVLFHRSSLCAGCGRNRFDTDDVAGRSMT